jgi:hypothetical protein
MEAFEILWVLILHAGCTSVSAPEVHQRYFLEIKYHGTYINSTFVFFITVTSFAKLTYISIYNRQVNSYKFYFNTSPVYTFYIVSK